MCRIFFFSFLFVALAGQTTAHAAFEVLGKSSQASAMSDAYIVNNGGADALWYNPAGLAQEGPRQIQIDYSRLYPGLDIGPDINTWALTYVQKMAGGKLGVGIAGIGADFYMENGLVVGFGRSFGEKTDIGIGLRMLRWAADGYRDPNSGVRDDDRSGTQPGFDIGMRYSLLQIEEGMVSIGLSGQHLNEPDTSRRLLFGIGYDNRLYRAEVDLELIDGDNLVRLGGEYKVGGPYEFRVRAGASGIVGEGAAGAIDGGLGLKFGSLKLDYAYHYSSEITAGANQSLALGFSF